MTRPPRTLAAAGRRRRRALAAAEEALEHGIEILRARIADGSRVDVTAAAKQLGVSRPTIYKRLPELGRDADEQTGAQP